jgi:hypothetical protein
LLLPKHIVLSHPLEHRLIVTVFETVSPRNSLPSGRVGVGAELHDSTNAGILISVAEDPLDGRERVLTAAVARCDPPNIVGIVQSSHDLFDHCVLRCDKVKSAGDEANEG